MIWTMEPTAKKLEDVETKVGNVGSTDLQSQVNTLNSKVGNVGSTDLQSQVNALNSNMPTVTRLTLSYVNSTSLRATPTVPSGKNIERCCIALPPYNTDSIKVTSFVQNGAQIVALGNFESSNTLTVNIIWF